MALRRRLGILKPSFVVVWKAKREVEEDVLGARRFWARRSMVVVAAVRRGWGCWGLRLGFGGDSESEAEGEEEGGWVWVLPGVAERKEREARRSVREVGFVGAAMRWEGCGGRGGLLAGVGWRG